MKRNVAHHFAVYEAQFPLSAFTVAGTLFSPRLLLVQTCIAAGRRFSPRLLLVKTWH